VLGKIILENITAEKLKGKKTTFSLYAPYTAYKMDNNQLPRNYYVLATDTEEECDAWVSSLRTYSYKTSKNKALGGSIGSGGLSPSSSSSTGVSGVDEHDSKKQQKRLEKKRQDERKVRVQWSSLGHFPQHLSVFLIK
jgi:hypothetical protein